MKVLLVRHTAPALPAGTCYGRLDLALMPGTDLDRFAAALDWSGIGRVWTSPARRCHLLADAVARQAGKGAIVDPRLQELDFGSWEGRLWADVPRAAVDDWAAAPLTFAPPDGETGARFLARVRAFCSDLRRTGEDCVVVTHGGPLRIMPALLRDELPDLLAPAPPFGAAIPIEI